MIMKLVEIVKKIVSRAYQTLIKAAQTLSQHGANWSPKTDIQVFKNAMITKTTLTLETGSQAALNALSVSMKVGKQVDVVCWAFKI